MDREYETKEKDKEGWKMRNEKRKEWEEKEKEEM